jgi:hypothetical protein
MKRILPPLAIVLFCSFLKAQTLDWVKQLGSGPEENAYAMALDRWGNIFLTGSFDGLSDFDPGPGVFNLNAAGMRDIFVLKLDPTGNLLWAKSMGAAGDDVGTAIACDTAGNVVVTGHFKVMELR